MSEIEEQIEILRRIGERGLKTTKKEQLDIWIHLLDEIGRLKKMYTCSNRQLDN